MGSNSDALLTPGIINALKNAYFRGQIKDKIYIRQKDIIDLDLGITELPTLQNNDVVQIKKGQVVMSDGVSGCKLWTGLRKAIGLITKDTAIGFANPVQSSGIFQMSDWTNVVGSTNLTVGIPYYADYANPGKLTATAPTLAGTVQPIGVAIKTDTLEIRIGHSTLL